MNWLHVLKVIDLPWRGDLRCLLWSHGGQPLRLISTEAPFQPPLVLDLPRASLDLPQEIATDPFSDRMAIC